jgi:hypothetical protein
VKIEGRDGTPDPDRWYILTQDPAADNGVHEFVVSNGQIVASRAVSQFAESLAEADMLGAEPLNIDSDKAAQLARDYAAANGDAVTSINYELKRDGPDAEPAWRVWCTDDKGNRVGEVVVTAGRGDIVSHEGFLLEPAPVATPTPETNVNPDVATPAPAASSSPPASTEAQPPKKQNAIAKAFGSMGRALEKLNPF